MIFCGFNKENQKLINVLEEHLDENYIHIRHIEYNFGDKIRVVFFIRKNEWGYVHLKGYEYYIEIGKEAYCNYIDQIILEELKHLRIFKKDKDLYKEIEKRERLLIINYINKDKSLQKLNSMRSRNFIIYRAKSMDLVYDSLGKELMFVSNIPFSDIEHDTNRKYTEEICVELVLDFQKSKEKFIRLLSNPYNTICIFAYRKYIDILNGDSDFSEQDIIVMISILGRLNQESKMGPISVQVDYKLNPENVSKHITIKN